MNKVGKYDIEVTTFQMAVLFAWNERPDDKLSFHDLRLVNVNLANTDVHYFTESNVPWFFEWRFTVRVKLLRVTPWSVFP